MATVDVLKLALALVLSVASVGAILLMYLRYVDFADEVERDALQQVMMHERIWTDESEDGFRD